MLKRGETKGPKLDEASYPFFVYAMNTPSLVTRALAKTTGALKKRPFLCNVCCFPNAATTGQLTREDPTCRHCGSNVRFRSLVHALSLSLFRKSIPLPWFSSRPLRRGYGMSDWHGYANRLKRKFDYQNTFYHQEPRLDITQLPEAFESKFDFVISSDVFEHINPPVNCAFQNVFRSLKPGGVFVLTVPFLETGETQEHYPDLNNFEIVESNGNKRLHNKTKQGHSQWFDAPVFHEGDGATLEMRLFTYPSLVRQLLDAGFIDVVPYNTNVARFGIHHHSLRSFPLTARRSKIALPDVLKAGH